jgi:hypothetical protein
MDIQQIMQQAQVMQQKMEEMQAKLGDIVVEGQAGGGMVSIKMTCKGTVEEVKIVPDAVDSDDVEMLEDLIKAAFNDAKAKADQTLAEKTQEMMQEMGLPSNFQLPF